MSLLTFDEAVQKFGPIVDGKWEREGEFCSVLDIPPEIGKLWNNSATGMPVTHIYMNHEMQAPLLGALQNLLYRGLLDQLYSYDGCYQIRKRRGLSTPSWHSYALAIDLNAGDNPLGGPSSLSPEFIKAFKDVGFIWGGDWSRPDPMHFQWALD